MAYREVLYNVIDEIAKGVTTMGRKYVITITRNSISRVQQVDIASALLSFAVVQLQYPNLSDIYTITDRVLRIIQ